jgi:hypothetical protein
MNRLASCLVAAFDGAILSLGWKEALCDKFFKAAPHHWPKKKEARIGVEFRLSIAKERPPGREPAGSPLACPYRRPKQGQSGRSGRPPRLKLRAVRRCCLRDHSISTSQLFRRPGRFPRNTDITLFFRLTSFRDPRGHGTCDRMHEDVLGLSVSSAVLRP